MQKIWKNGIRGAAACGLGAAMLTGAVSGAMADDKVSGTAGVSYNSHFISYGLDVWGAGDDFYGDRSTTFVFTNIDVAITDDLGIYFGAWGDVNDNTNSAIGGDIQEVDVWVGANYAIDIVTLGAAYQRWNYASDVEEIVDLSVGLDDSAWMGDYALSPKLVWHIRTSGNGGQEPGSALVASIGPGFDLTDSVSLTIPAGVAFFMDEDFQGGTEDGYAYSYLGASVGVPLEFIPSDYGVWNMNFDLIGYSTEEDAIPGNPEDSFLTASVGLTLAF